MKQYQHVCNRTHTKYMLSRSQYQDLIQELQSITPIEQCVSKTVLNLYFDTPDYQLVRSSLKDPACSEKLRLRSNGIPAFTSNVSFEIKKKYDGLVYRRSSDMRYMDALKQVAQLSGDGIVCETSPSDADRMDADFLFDFYPGLAPRMALSYDRTTLRFEAEPSLRITLDSNIRWRTTHLNLSFGNAGEPLLDPGQHLLEIRSSGPIPVALEAWLAQNDLQPISFSKYENAYRAMTGQTLSHLAANKMAQNDPTRDFERNWAPSQARVATKRRIHAHAKRRMAFA